MAKRKTIVVSVSVADWYSAALGFQPSELFHDLFKNGFLVPIDFDQVEQSAGCALDAASRQAIQSECDDFVRCQAKEFFQRRAVEIASEFGTTPQRTMPKADFDGLVEKLHRHAQQLEDLVDQLLDFVPALAMWPSNSRMEAGSIFAPAEPVPQQLEPCLF